VADDGTDLAERDLAQIQAQVDAIVADEARFRPLVRRIVRSFNADFDAPLAHDRCLGVLTLLGVAEPPADRDDLDRLSGWLGAATCRITRADVGYQYLDALETIEASRADAARVEQILARAKGSEGAPIATYALARWLDAVGKIDYRFGDYSTAKLTFERAMRLAAGAGHASCLPDMESNVVRADFEARKTAGATNAELIESYAALKARVIGELAAAGVPGPSGWKADLRRLPMEGRERLRGVTSVLHNLSIALEKSERYGEALVESELSADIGRALSDPYRYAQARLTQGRIRLEQRRLDEARACFVEVFESPWGRGRRIAAQSLGRIDADTQVGEYARAMDRFLEVFEAFQADRARRGADLGMDAPFLEETVQHFRAALAAARGHLPDERLADLEQIARREGLHAARSVRRVVKVEKYKLIYSKTVRPAYLRETALRLADAARLGAQGGRDDEVAKTEDSILLLAEEATARELLDAMAAGGAEARDPFDEVDVGGPARRRENGAPAPAQPLPPAVAAARPATDARRGAELRRGRRDDALSAGQVKEIEARLEAYERTSLDAPVATTAINPEIAHELRLFTASARDPRQVIVRYFFEGEAEGARRLRAYVAREGRSYITGPLDVAPVLREAASWTSACGPSPRFAGILFEKLLRPLWAHLEGPGRLVIIPTDELLGLPLHVAIGRETDHHPLAAVKPICFSVSAAAYVERRRHMRARFPVEPDDDLFVFMEAEADTKAGVGVSGHEIVGLPWPKEHLYLHGRPPEALDAGAYTRVTASSGPEAIDQLVEQLAEVRPELFLYASHGQLDAEHERFGPMLKLGDTQLTQFDVARKVRLPRNKIAVLAACVTGRGASAAGGEVAGFLRALMAAGAGAIGLTLWSVIDHEIVQVVGGLLRRIADAKGKEPFDVVEELHALYAKAPRYRQPDQTIESCPLAIYL
jgi:tetratricopeptide (TPR) repeat protein